MKHNTPHYAYLLELSQQLEKRELLSNYLQRLDTLTPDWLKPSFPKLIEEAIDRSTGPRRDTLRAFMLLKDLRIAKIASDMLDAMAKDPEMREAAAILRWKFNTAQAFGHGRG